MSVEIVERSVICGRSVDSVIVSFSPSGGRKVCVDRCVMASASDFLRVFETGETTVVGFAGSVLPDQLDLESIRQELGAMLRQNGSSAIAFNLSGVAFLPSAMLGLLAALTRDGFRVHLHNPSANLRSVLEVTRLNRLFTVHELGV